MASNLNSSGGKNTFRVTPESEKVWDKWQKEQKPNQPVLIDLVNLERLYFQTIPTEIEYDPKTEWATLPSIGRNSPFYQYTGAEDTITFTVSWYSRDKDRKDVLSKCKWLESLSKPDGYENGVHPVQLIFGTMYKDSKWIVYSAPYRLRLFNRQIDMLPQLATQEITLKRISDINPRTQDYRNLSY